MVRWGQLREVEAVCLVEGSDWRACGGAGPWARRLLVVQPDSRLACSRFSDRRLSGAHDILSHFLFVFLLNFLGEFLQLDLSVFL